MSLTERIAVIIDSNAQGAIRGLTDTGVAAEGMGTKTTSAQGAIALLDRTGLAASTTIGSKLKAGISETGTVMGGLEKSGVSLGQVLGVGVAGGAVAGGAAIAGFALKGVSAFESATSEVRALQRTLGGTTEDASRLRFAAEALGVDLGAVERGAGLFTKAIGNGTYALKEHAVAVAHDSAGNVDMASTIANVAQAYQATNDPAEKAAIASDAFGRSYQQMIPFLSKSKSELKEIYGEAAKQHQIFSAQDADQGRQLSVATRELKSEITGLEIEVGKGLVPALSEGTRGLKSMLQAADSITAPLGGVGGAIGKVLEYGNPLPAMWDAAADAASGHFGDSLKDVVRATPIVGGALSDMTSWLDRGSDASDKAADQAKKHADSERERATAIQASTDAESKMTDQIFGILDADNAYTQSIRDLGASQDDYAAKVLAAAQAGGKNKEANDAEAQALVALHNQIDATARASAAKAEADLGPNAAGNDKARAGMDAYRASLMQAAQSSIPAVREQAYALLVQLNQVTQSNPTVTVHVDTEFAKAALDGLHQKFKDIQKEFQGGIGRVS